VNYLKSLNHFFFQTILSCTIKLKLNRKTVSHNFYANFVFFLQGPNHMLTPAKFCDQRHPMPPDYNVEHAPDHDGEGTSTM